MEAGEAEREVGEAYSMTTRVRFDTLDTFSRRPEGDNGSPRSEQQLHQAVVLPSLSVLFFFRLPRSVLCELLFHFLNLLFNLVFRELVPTVLTSAGFQLDVFSTHRALLFVLVEVELMSG